MEKQDTAVTNLAQEGGSNKHSYSRCRSIQGVKQAISGHILSAVYVHPSEDNAEWCLKEADDGSDVFNPPILIFVYAHHTFNQAYFLGVGLGGNNTLFASEGGK